MNSDLSNGRILSSSGQIQRGQIQRSTVMVESSAPGGKRGSPAPHLTAPHDARRGSRSPGHRQPCLYAGVRASRLMRQVAPSAPGFRPSISSGLGRATQRNMGPGRDGRPRTSAGRRGRTRYMAQRRCGGGCQDCPAPAQARRRRGYSPGP